MGNKGHSSSHLLKWMFYYKTKSGLHDSQREAKRRSTVESEEIVSILLL